jgi:phospholipid-transporting ATPase
MSTVVRGPDGKIKIYTKGADTVILERLNKHQPYTEKTMAHLEDYATEGLRTLCIAFREIPELEYKQWSAIYDQAAATINGRGEALDQAAELIEKDLFLLGATAIEDKLQDGVPDTIHTLQMAGIKVWVLTGDRQETAINIGMSCRLISESMNLVSKFISFWSWDVALRMRLGYRQRREPPRHKRILDEATIGHQEPEELW